MYVKFLNKNQNHPNSDEENFEIEEGSVFTETKNETLDTGTIIISNLDEPIDLEPYDIVEIPYLQKYMCVDTYTETLLCVNPKKYRYEISLFSETKQLEGIVLPNLKITKVWNKTRTVFDYIDRYLNLYCPKIKIDDGNNGYEYEYKWSWDTQTNRNKFNMQCPEMQWNTPTLREVLNDLMMVADCIPILKNGQISYFDLTQINMNNGLPVNWENNSHVNYVSKSRSSEDYVSELQVNLQNVTNQTEGVNNLVTKSEWIYFSPEENNVVLTTDNMVLKTQYPIYNLKSLIMFFPGHGNYNGDNPSGVNKWMSLDLVEAGIVSEYQEWITKKVDYNSQPPTRGDIASFANSQNWSVYYTRNSNEIKNWNHKTKYWWQNYFLYEELGKSIIRYLYNTVGGESVDSGWYGIFFKAEYETLEGCIFRASKGENTSHQRVVIDNQTNSMVDSYNQGFLEYQKANRLGNEQLQINARFNNGEQLIYIGDTYDDSVIYQCQYQYFKNHIEVNALATKNYILREYFTGVKSKIRSWRISDASEACFRQELIKYYCEFDYGIHLDKDMDNFDDYPISEYLMSPIYEYEKGPIKYVFIKTRSNDGSGNVWHPTQGYFNLDLISRMVGNSLIFTFNFNDNFWACQMLDTDIVDYDDCWVSAGSLFLDKDVLLEGKGFPLAMRSYTDGNGESIRFSLRFSEGIKISPYTKDYYPGDNIGGEDPDDLHSFMYAIWQKPHVYGDDSHPNIIDQRFLVYKDLYKDSQEIMGLSTQLEFCSNTTNISFGKQWLLRQKAINLSDNTVSGLKLVFYNSSQFNIRDNNNFPSSGWKEEGFTEVHTYTVNNTNASFYIIYKKQGYSTEAEARNKAIELKTNSSLYLCDTGIPRPNVLLTLNDVPNGNCFATQVEGDNLYYPSYLVHLNILKTRDKNIYDSDNHYLINRKM